jgi:hypothetical protein
LGRPKVVFLGYYISEKEAEPLLKHLEVIQALPRLWQVNGLQSFLASTSIRNSSKILLVLTSALRGEKKDPAVVVSTEGGCFRGHQGVLVQGHVRVP